MRGGLVKILQSLSPTLLFRDRARTWSVAELALTLEQATKTDDRAFVLYTYRDGRRAIVMVESNGSLSKTAAYVEVD